jgi:hypothetical protein
MEKSTKRIIDLIGFHGIGLIIIVESGVIYRSQAGGLACLHPEAEGVFLPLPVTSGASEMYALSQHFRGKLGHIDEEAAKVIDRILGRNGHEHLTVNPKRVKESFEAWVHVLIHAPGGRSRSEKAISGFGECEGILIWPNSD